MKNEYRRAKTSVSMVNYHIVFCPRYRRKIFAIDGVESLFKETVHQICEQNNFDIIAMECNVDHCHIFVNVPPDISAAKAVQIIKQNTSRVLTEYIDKLKNTKQLWTRSYFASTAGKVSSEIIKQYVEAQTKNNPYK